MIIFKKAHIGMEVWGRRNTCKQYYLWILPKKNPRREETNRQLGVYIEGPISEQIPEFKLIALQQSDLMKAVRV